jgi:hypothetical protein
MGICSHPEIPALVNGECMEGVEKAITRIFLYSNNIFWGGSRDNVNNGSNGLDGWIMHFERSLFERYNSVDRERSGGFFDTKEGNAIYANYDFCGIGDTKYILRSLSHRRSSQSCYLLD